jgi:hypothetical protein
MKKHQDGEDSIVYQDNPYKVDYRYSNSSHHLRIPPFKSFDMDFNEPEVLRIPPLFQKSSALDGSINLNLKNLNAHVLSSQKEQQSFRPLKPKMLVINPSR